MAQTIELNHPLVEHHLTSLRDKTTKPHIFREEITRLTLLLTYEASKELPLNQIDVETPLETAPCKKLDCRLGLVPILRAGLGMSEAILNLIPEAETWHLGFFRDETTYEPVEYYQKFSDHPPEIAFVIDPMLATGGSACEAIEKVKKWGVKKILLLCIISAPEGIKRVEETHPDVNIYTCVIDRCLSDSAYILPGVGDAGDRIFNTH